MKFKGAWYGDVKYSVGDVVTYEDGFVYHLQKSCDAGVRPVNTLYWGKMSQYIGEVVNMFAGMFDDILAKIPNNIDDEGIVLKGTDDAEYLITVDDSGETPELAVELIEEEGDGD